MKTFFLMLLLTAGMAAMAQKYSYLEAFNDNKNNWETGHDDLVDLRIESGYYYYKFTPNETHKGWNMWNVSSPLILPVGKNYCLKMKAKGMLGDAAGHFGLRWNSTGPSIYDSVQKEYTNRNAYSFVLRNDGYAALFHNVVKGELDMVVPWTKVKVFYAGKDNEFSVINSGNDFRFYMNGIKVFTHRIDVSKGIADIGFKLTGKGEMAIDYLSIKEQ